MALSREPSNQPALNPDAVQWGKDVVAALKELDARTGVAASEIRQTRIVANGATSTANGAVQQAESVARSLEAIPEAPDEFSLVSNATSWDENGNPRATVVLSWEQVTLFQDGTPLTSDASIQNYEVWTDVDDPELARRVATVMPTVNVDIVTPGVVTETVALENLFRDKSYKFYVRAVTVRGGYSLWSNELVVLTDNTPDPLLAPSAPIAVSGLGAVTVRWDGKDILNNVPSSRMDYAQIFMLDSSNDSRSLVRNPNMLAGYSTSNGGGSTTLSSPVIPNWSGRARRMTFTAPTTNANSVFLSTASALGNGPIVEVGKTYTMSFWARSNIATTLQAQLPWRNAAGSNFASVYSDSAGTLVVPNEWTRFVVTATAPATAVEGGLRLRLPGAASVPQFQIGDWIEYAGLMFTEGTTAPDYFDGNTPDTEEFTYEWAGTPGTSDAIKTGQYVPVGQQLRAAGGVVLTDIPVGATRTFKIAFTDKAGDQGAFSASATVLVAGVDLGDLDAEVSDAIQQANDAAEAAQTTANGKNSITRSDLPASVVGDEVAGDLWFQYLGGAVIGMWIWGGSSWVSQDVDGAVLANIDAGTITVGYLNGERIEVASIGATQIAVGSLTGDRFAANTITANEIAFATLTGNQIAAGSITVTHLAAGLGGQLDISANSSINLVVGQISNVEADLGTLGTNVEDMQTYYQFGPAGATISSPNSPYQLALRNDQIQIQENGTAVSWWDAGQMHVPSFVGDEVILGNHKLEKYGTGTVVRAI